jgi:hypothetical protein
VLSVIGKHRLFKSLRGFNIYTLSPVRYMQGLRDGDSSETACTCTHIPADLYETNCRLILKGPFPLAFYLDFKLNNQQKEKGHDKNIRICLNAVINQIALLRKIRTTECSSQGVTLGNRDADGGYY